MKSCPTQGEMCTPLGLRKNLPATVFKTLPVNCTGKLCHRMTEETISCNRGLNQLLWALILSVFCKISFVSNKLSCYNAQQQSNYSIHNKQVKFIFHNQKNMTVLSTTKRYFKKSRKTGTYENTNNHQISLFWKLFVKAGVKNIIFTVW